MFGRPTRLEAEERVWLVADRLPPGAQIQVNEHDAGQVDSKGTWMMDITSLLQVRNRLCVILTRQTETGAQAMAGGDSHDLQKASSETSGKVSVVPAQDFVVRVCIYAL
jgi:hypothetical protein